MTLHGLREHMCTFNWTSQEHMALHSIGQVTLVLLPLHAWLYMAATHTKSALMSWQNIAGNQA